MSKDRILELYLNCIEFGKDLYGIEPAAQYYFNKSARELTPMEAVFLAVLKPSPKYGDHLKRRGELPGPETWFAKRVEAIFKRMVEYKIMTQAEADRARPYTLRWEGGVYKPQATGGSGTVDELLQELIEPW